MSEERPLLDPRLEHLFSQRSKVNRALRVGGRFYTIGDVAEGIIKGNFQYWNVNDSAIVTEILVSPRRKVINYFMAFGDLSDVLGLQTQVDAFAKQHGCDGAIMGGRTGWDRVLPLHGWKKGGTSMMKDFA